MPVKAGASRHAQPACCCGPEVNLGQKDQGGEIPAWRLGEGGGDKGPTESQRSRPHNC